ncbi:hypothetical protein HOY80DRAFT_1028511 [Tuber brumale]|nr:hypothetical protein HOY80DRAFT_1028511 [Tuber brumale]
MEDMALAKPSILLPPKGQQSVAPQSFFDPVPMRNSQSSIQGFGCSTASHRSQIFSSAVSKALSPFGRKRSTPYFSQLVQIPSPPTHPSSLPFSATGISVTETSQQNFKASSGAPYLPELHFCSDPLMELVPSLPGLMEGASLVDIKSKSNVSPITSERYWDNRSRRFPRDILHEETLFPRDGPLQACSPYQSTPSTMPVSVTNKEVIQNSQTVDDLNIRYYLQGDIPEAKVHSVNGQLETEARMSFHSGHPLGITLLDFPESVWKNISTVIEPWDLSCLSRCSKALQKAIDPHLYAEINLCTNQPHGFSYAYLSKLLGSLTEPGNHIKLGRYVKRFRISGGWEENSIKLCDGAAPLTTDDVRDTGGEKMLNSETVIELIKAESIEEDGGIKEVNRLLATFLNHALGLETFILDTAIPLRRGLIATIAAVSTIRRVEINIAQPTRTQRNVDDWRVVEKSLLGKYRPKISLFSELSLFHLRLTNLPTRGGPWYVGLWKLIGELATLRVLQVELPVINRTRYPNAFDEEGWLVSPAGTFTPKMPPIWKGRTSCVHTLTLSGFIVDAAIIKNVKSLSLIGCMRMKSRIRPKWASLEYFRCTGWAFIDLAMNSTDRTTRELHFTTITGEGSPSPVVDLTKKIFLEHYPTLHNLMKLTLKPQWNLAPHQIACLFHHGNRLMHLGLWVPEEAWKHFLLYVPSLHRIQKLHIFNGGVDRIEEMAGRLIASDRVYQGTIIAIGKCAWRITLVRDLFDDWQWGFERVRGELDEVLGKGLGGGY